VHPAVVDAVSRHAYPLLFVTISGAHLYGFPSPDSDYDVRGVHVLPAHEVLALDKGPATITEMRPGTPEIDLVTHDVEKFFRFLLRPNGYVLEQLYSPLVVSTSAGHSELKEIAKGCITRLHVRHYLGFARNQWRLVTNEKPPRVKPLLYVYRVLLTGIHLMRTGVVEASLIRLNAECSLPYIDRLVGEKLAGERVVLGDSDLAFHEREFARLLAELELAGHRSHLPEVPSGREALGDLLMRLRLERA
jgi:uncharacterized protein